MKLLQKKYFIHRRQFEIHGDTLFVNISSLVRSQLLTISLASLEGEPQQLGDELVFNSRFAGQPAVRFLLDKPDRVTFKAFVDTVQERINTVQEGGANNFVSDTTRDAMLMRNVYDAPPEFEKASTSRKSEVEISSVRLEGDIEMLRSYLDEKDIQVFLDALERLRNEPNSTMAYDNMLRAYNDLGFHQGAVLTYSNYLKVLLSQSVWD